MKCLEKERSRRYETVNGLASDIQRHLNNEPVVARPPSKLYEFQKTVRRHKFGFAATAIVILVLAAGTLQAVRATRAEREQRRLREEAQAARKDATDQLWAAYLSEARALRVSGKAGRRFESLEAIRKAVTIRPSLELRNEAIAAILLTDIRLAAEKNFTKERATVITDARFERYAICESNATVSIRRLADDRELSRLPPVGASPIGPLLFSLDGRWLAVRYRDRMIRVWDLTSNKLTLTLSSGRNGGFDFSPDSGRAAISDATNIVMLEVASGRRLGTFPLGELGSDSDPGFRFDPSGQRLAFFGIEPGTNVFVLDANSGAALKALPHPSGVFDVAWHPNGQQLVTTGMDSLLYLWNASTGEKLRTFSAGQVVRAAFNHQGNLLATSGWDGRTRLWELASGRELINISRSGGIHGFSPDDRKLVLATWDQTQLLSFDVAECVGLDTIYERPDQPRGGGIAAAAFSHNGRLVAYRTLDGLAVRDVVEGRLVGILPTEGSLIGFSAGDNELLFTGPEGLFRWPIHNPSANGRITGGPSTLASSECAVATGGGLGGVSADGRTCAIVGKSRCQLFRTDTFVKLSETAIQPAMRWAALNPDGSLLATGDWHAPGVKVWHTKTGGLLKDLPADDGSRDTAASVCFSRDGRFLITSISSECCFWKVNSWEPEHRMTQPPGHEFTGALAISPDNKIFAAGHTVNVIRLYDAATGAVLADLEATYSGVVTSLAFNAAGTQLAASESGDAFRIWNLKAIREELATLGLDWEQPPYPPEDFQQPLKP